MSIHGLPSGLHSSNVDGCSRKALFRFIFLCCTLCFIYCLSVRDEVLKGGLNLCWCSQSSSKQVTPILGRASLERGGSELLRQSISFPSLQAAHPPAISLDSPHQQRRRLLGQAEPECERMLPRNASLGTCQWKVGMDLEHPRREETWKTSFRKTENFGSAAVVVVFNL